MLFLVKRIFFGLIICAIYLMADMDRNDKGIVVDNETHLEWQDNYSDNHDIVKKENWKNAILYCNRLPLNGGGWRLPNINELKSIVKYEKLEPSIDDSFKIVDNSFDSSYWSSTTNTKKTNNAWVVLGNGGSVGSYNAYSLKTSSYSVRCVRDSTTSN